MESGLESSRWQTVLLAFVAPFLLIYPAFLVTSITFFDANTPLDVRILSPYYVAALVLAAPSVESIARTVARRRLPRASVGVIAGIAILLAAAQSARLILSGYREGIGFNAASWRRSEILAWVHPLPSDTLIYSNSPEAVYLLTGRSAVRIPRVLRLSDRTMNSSYGAELASMSRALLERDGLVVMFSTVRGVSMPTSIQLRDELALTPVFEGADGEVYALALAR
jgi:hypothetical protein